MSDIDNSGEQGVFRFPWVWHNRVGSIWTFVANARSGRWESDGQPMQNEFTWSKDADEKHISWALGFVRGRRWFGIGWQLCW